MITLYRRNKVFWLRRCEFGKEFRQSLRTRDAQTARALLRQLELDALSGGKVKQLTWPDFQAEFLAWVETQVRPSTLRGYRITANHFGRFLGAAVSLGNLTPTAVAAYLEVRKRDIHPFTKRAISPDGIRFDLRCLHRIFAYAVESGYVATNPVTQRHRGSTAGKTLPFTQKEIAAMLADRELSPQLRAIVLTFLHTGLRISDVVNLQKMSIVGTSLIRQTIKRGKVVSLRIHPKLKTALESHFAAQNAKQRASAYVFSAEGGLPLKNNLRRKLKSLWKRCGIVGAHPHRFRHSFAVRLLSKGGSLYEVAKLMGISVQTADRHYAHYVQELQQRGARLVGKLDFVAG